MGVHSQEDTLTSGDHTVGSRVLRVTVPSGSEQRPVLIFLHGKIEDGFVPHNRLRAESVTSSHIVAIVSSASGSHGTWNIKGEPAAEMYIDDVGYVTNEVIGYLAGHSNVKADFRILGFSNGAMLATASPSSRT